ncbi:hypothetical protein CPC08DRAFT_820366 [Agrocybe pediades]|nr:hypothetical protein CPC08DRAFT_820366 [Agrocybe pediades]
MKVKVQDNGLRLRSNLPVEIHGLIINELEDEKDALKQCALTCRLYRHLAQTLLFKAIVLELLPEPESNPAQKLLAILAQSPRIVNYVRCLTFSVNFFAAAFFGKWFGMPDPDDSWVPEVLCALVNVRRLHIGLPAHETCFPELSPATMAMVHSKCQSVLHLTVEDIRDVPWTILTNLNSVESLDLNNAHFLPDISGQPASQTVDFHMSFPHLKRISYSTSSMNDFPGKDVKSIQSFLSFLEQSTARGGLESLSINIHNALVPATPTHFQAVKQIISNSAESLKTVDVTLSTHVPVLLPNDELIFDDSSMPLLTELSNNELIFNVSSMPLLTELSLTCVISPITFHCFSRHLETVLTSGMNFNKISLHPIITNSSLVTEKKFDDECFKYFENLVLNVVLPQTLSLSVKFTIYGPHSTRGAETLIKQCMPALHAKNLLQFDTKRDAPLEPDI